MPLGKLMTRLQLWIIYAAKLSCWKSNTKLMTFCGGQNGRDPWWKNDFLQTTRKWFWALWNFHIVHCSPKMEPFASFLRMKRQFSIRSKAVLSYFVVVQEQLNQIYRSGYFNHLDNSIQRVPLKSAVCLYTGQDKLSSASEQTADIDGFFISRHTSQPTKTTRTLVRR